MNQLVTKGIVLARTDYGEADRILTVLTPDQGKLRLMAKGVRRPKSKLAGGIELFSVSDITFIRGRGEIGALISSRLERHYGQIVKDIRRVQLGYELIKLLNKITEDEPGVEYFVLLKQAFDALNDSAIGEQLIGLWFNAQLLRLGGHSPNLQTDAHGNKLRVDANYSFDFESMSFTEVDGGRFGADHIKFLRLLFSGNEPRVLGKVSGSNSLFDAILPLVQGMASVQLVS